jgi:hypothetical protein
MFLGGNSPQPEKGRNNSPGGRMRRVALEAPHCALKREKEVKNDLKKIKS